LLSQLCKLLGAAGIRWRDKPIEPLLADAKELNEVDEVLSPSADRSANRRCSEADAVSRADEGGFSVGVVSELTSEAQLSASSP